MTPRTRLFVTRLALSLAIGFVLPSAAAAQDRAPDEGLSDEIPEPEPPHTRFIMRQRLIALLNPMGAEHYLELASRTRIGDQDSLLFTGAHFEAGALTSVSPVYATGGGYAQLSPLSFLVLRAQLAGEGIWPIGMDGAGYYGFDAYDYRLDPQSLSANDAGSATGWRATFSGTLQGMVPIGNTRILFLNKLAGERAHVGESPYYYDVRNDIVRARADWLLMNDVFLGIDVVVDSSIIFRAGVYDSLRYLPASGEANNQIGPLVMMIFDRPNKALAAVEPFVRAGYYTHHGSRDGEATILGGISLRYDLGSL